MSYNGNGKKDIISARYLVNTTHASPGSTPHTRNRKIVLSSAKTTFRPPQQQPLARHRYPPLPFALDKSVDDMGSSDDNNKKNSQLLRNELMNMQSECNRLRKEHDIAIKNLVDEHKTTIATLTKKHEATKKDMMYYKMMAELKTNLMTSIDETHPGTFGRSYCYDTHRRHSDPPVHRLKQMVTQAMQDDDFGTKVHDRPLATSTGAAKKCFVPPLHSEIRAMKPKYLANHHHHHHHGRKSTESIISGLTMPTSLLDAVRTTRPPASIYTETTQSMVERMRQID